MGIKCYEINVQFKEMLQMKRAKCAGMLVLTKGVYLS